VTNDATLHNFIYKDIIDLKMYKEIFKRKMKNLQDFNLAQTICKNFGCHKLIACKSRYGRISSCQKSTACKRLAMVMGDVY
jgi:hypothetical protein